MAEEVRGSVTGGNGERLELKLGSKSVGIAAQSLIPILLLICGLVGGYLIYINVSDALKLLYTQQHQMVEGLAQAQVKILEMLHEQDLKMVEALRTQDSQLSAQTEVIRRLLLVHDANQGRQPEERMPLELDPSLLRQAPR